MHGFDAARDVAEVARLAEALGFELPAAAASELARFVELVARWNRRLDLTAARDATALVEVMLADALVLADPELVPAGSRLLDVGSGAGAPVLPLLLVRPDLTAVLVEPRRKRVAFLRTAAGTLGLSRAEVLEQRLEPGQAPPGGGRFDVAVSRATFEPARWLELALPLSPRVLVLTARDAPPPAPTGGVRGAVRRYRVPSTGAPRQVGVYLRE